MRSLLKLLSLLLLAHVVFGYVLHSDHFDEFDLSKWVIEVVENPHNNEKQYYTDRPVNLNVTDGQLVITPYKETFGSKQYTSGRLYSNFSWLYGRVQVRAKLPSGYGLWPAIWMLPTDEIYGGWPQSGEIDIVEARGQEIQQVQSAIHFGGVCCSNTASESSGPLETQCSINDFHVYELDWTPTELVFRFDGKAIYRSDLDRILKDVYDEKGQPFDKRFHLVLNVAVGGHFLSGPDPDTVWEYPDAQMKVDYVRVFPLTDIATTSCRAKAGLSNAELCTGVSIACNYPCHANLQHLCADRFDCCDNPASCDDSLHDNASALYKEYHSQVGGDESCDFEGTAEYYNVQLHDEGPEKPQCLVSESADNNGLCGSINWACFSQSFSNVTLSCNAATDMLSCCGSSPQSCPDLRLREASQQIFQEYYDNNPRSTSCDFGGKAYLVNPIVPLECNNEYRSD